MAWDRLVVYESVCVYAEERPWQGKQQLGAEVRMQARVDPAGASVVGRAMGLVRLIDHVQTCDYDGLTQTGHSDQAEGCLLQSEHARGLERLGSLAV